MSYSGVIVSPSDVPVRKILPLTTVVSIIDAVSTATPFVVPPPPDIERPVMQAQDFSNCRLTKSREFLSSFRLSASSQAPMLLRTQQMIRRYEETNRLRLERPCCRRRQMTEWFRVWMFCRVVCAVSGVGIPLFLTCMCDGLVCNVGRKLRCFRLGLFSGYLQHCRRNHQPLQRPGPRGRTCHYRLDCRVVRTDTRSPAICCIPMETRHKDCCILFSPSASHGVWSHSVFSLGVLLTFGL